MSFLRPEAVATLTRWRECLIGAIALLLGGWWAFGAGRFLTLPGWALIAVGAALILIGLQRARFRSSGLGAGEIQIDEGQVSYFGPLNGGIVSLRELERLTLRKSMSPMHWQLDQPGQAPVLIPANALGSDGLFDAFAALDGLKTHRMLAELQNEQGSDVVIWERSALRSPEIPLH